ncbi:MAG: EF-P beta-lysylation protein EpmB [Pseudomonadales bacterium]
MIPQTETIAHTENWQNVLANGIRTPQALLDYVGLGDYTDLLCEAAHQEFAVRIPRPFADKIERGKPDDPLLLQALPLVTEMLEQPGFNKDPLAEQGSSPVPGILHKYHGRALLIVTGACAIHCRYCFRRHFPYNEHSKPQRWHEALEYIRQTESLNEIILSGGDPLSLGDKQLADLTRELAAIPHLKRLRIHTRLPLMIPQRVTDELIAWLSQSRLQATLVLHCNHANEICPQTAQAITKLRQAGIWVLNQAVLLKGINDDIDSQCQLSEALFSAGALPYYLHLLDPVAGAAHFAVETDQAAKLYQQMLASLPGYLVPRLVREIAGEASKTPFYKI